MANLRALMAFAEVARRHSFAAAARELGLTPSAVTKSINRMEQEFNLRLFHRTTRQVALTPEGELLFARCQRMLHEVEEVESFATDLGQAVAGVLRIDAPITYGKLVVLPLLAELGQAHPLLQCDVRLSDKYADIVGEGLDAAIRIGHLQDSTLRSRAFDTQRLGVYASPAYLQRHGQPARPADLTRQECAVFRLPTSGRPRAWHFKEDGKESELVPHARFSVNDGEGLIALALSGAALVQTPDYMARSLLEAGVLKEVLASYRPDALPISIVYSSARHVPLRLRMLIDHLCSRNSAQE